MKRGKLKTTVFTSKAPKSTGTLETADFYISPSPSPGHSLAWPQA